jgi:hypothetical protein
MAFAKKYCWAGYRLASETFVMRRGIVVKVYALLVLSGMVIWAQATKTTPNPAYTNISQIPSHLRQQFRAMGDRLQIPGKERLSLAGSVVANGSTTPIEIVWELGGNINVQGPAKSIVFQKQTDQQVVATLDQGWIESLVDDLPDSIMSEAVSGAGIRMLGRRFSDGQGGLCDYYDAPVPSSVSPKEVRWKRFCFDPDTLRLRFVRYTLPASPSVVIETWFGDWRISSGQLVPGQIKRTEGGLTIFTIQAQSVGVSARANDSLFVVKQ